MTTSDATPTPEPMPAPEPAPEPAPQPTPQPAPAYGAPGYSAPTYGAAGYPGATPPPPHIPAPPAPMLESEARTIAMLIHIIAAAVIVLSGGTLAFVVPLVMWLIYRERSALIDYHGKLNLNLQITVVVAWIAAGIIGLVTFGIGLFVTIPLAGAYAIYALVMSIIAGVKASRGEYTTIPMVIRFVR